MGIYEAGFPAFQVDAERARAFVLATGDERSQARLWGIFGRMEPDRTVARALEQVQNSDGGFPAGLEPGAASSVTATCAVLAHVKEMPPLAGSPMASRAVAFLRRSQQSDGSWREGETLAPAYLTAQAAFALITLEPEHVDPIARASRWLRVELGRPGAGEQADAATLALAAAVWHRMVGPRGNEQAWAFELLGRRRLTPAQLATWLTAMLEVGIDGGYFVTVWRLLSQLADAQQPDGSWPADDGDRVESTLGALRVLRGFRLL